MPRYDYMISAESWTALVEELTNLDDPTDFEIAETVRQKISEVEGLDI